MEPAEELSAKVIGQIALMQSVIVRLQGKVSILNFLCQGLRDVPGVQNVEYNLYDDNMDFIQEVPQRQSIKEFFIKYRGRTYAQIILDLSDADLLLPYIPYINNLCTVLAVLFEEQFQRKKNEEIMENLEKMVEQRTKELELEIEKKKNTESMLRESEKQFRNLFENAEVSIWNEDISEVYAYIQKWKADGVKDLREFVDNDTALLWDLVSKIKVNHVNQATLKLFEAETEESLLEQVEKTFGDNAINVFIDEICAIWEGKDLFRSEVNYVSLKEKRISAIISIRLPRTQEEAKRVPLTIVDITERKKSEEEKELLKEQLAQSRKMDAVGQLAGGVAHDFNNTLGAILGAAQLIERNVDKAEKIKKYAKMIINTSRKAGNLTKQLLNFSRKGVNKKQALDFTKVVEEVVFLLEKTIDKSVKITVDNQAKTSVVIGDFGALQNAVMNIGINASHAMPEGGELTFSTKNTFFDHHYCKFSNFDIKPGHYIELAIQDTGTGMTKEVMERIFEPFFTTKEQGKGTGLGLATVYGTVKEHHGAINVYSELGSGTVFQLYFPISEKTIEEKHEENNFVKGNGTILLVDDEEVIREVGEAQLEDLGYNVILAENGEEGLMKFNESQGEIDLVILDMIMPRMGGKEAFEKMRAVNEQIPIIIASGFSRGDDLEVMRAKGINGFLQKPFLLNELSENIEKAMNRL